MPWSKTYTFSPSTTIASAEINKNFDDCISAVNAAMPSGLIVIWSGSIASIPTGFYLCNGSNSTPDLRDKFVVGAGSTYAVAATGGAATIDISHTHLISGNTGSTPSNLAGVDGYGEGTEVAQGRSPGHSHTVSITSNSKLSATQSILPPYYALAYIMKS